MATVASTGEPAGATGGAPLVELKAVTIDAPDGKAPTQCIQTGYPDWLVHKYVAISAGTAFLLGALVTYVWLVHVLPRLRDQRLRQAHIAEVGKRISQSAKDLLSQLQGVQLGSPRNMNKRRGSTSDSAVPAKHGKSLHCELGTYEFDVFTRAVDRDTLVMRHMCDCFTDDPMTGERT